jgi:hypothetical protein
MNLNISKPTLTSAAPAKQAIRYEKRRLWRDIDGPNPYTGAPRPEFDEAWRNIIERMLFGIDRIPMSNYENSNDAQSV